MTQDFAGLLAEHGLEEVPSYVRALYESHEDQIGYPSPVYVAVRKSSIEGLGLFATMRFETGRIIAPLRFGKFRTPAGRYANHSDDPNTSIIKVGECITLKACRDIEVDEEITIDYRSALKEGK